MDGKELLVGFLNETCSHTERGVGHGVTTEVCSSCMEHAIDAAIAQAVEREREACAMIAEDHALHPEELYPQHAIAAAIRARRDTP